MTHRPPPRIRLTMPTRAVLDLLLAADVDDPPWGYRICELAELGPGTVYPILERLEEAGWIFGKWENADPKDRPKRRTYTLTDAGGREYAAALAKKRRPNRLSWVLGRGQA